VPGATDDLIAVRKSKAPKPAAKHVTELPVEPQYEYQLPTATKEDKNSAQLTAEELKVCSCVCGGGSGVLVCVELGIHCWADGFTRGQEIATRDMSTLLRWGG
jgi:hypothetical protein